MTPWAPCPFEKIHPSQLNRDDAFYMALAFNFAIDAWRANEVPVGAIIVAGGEVIGAAHNQIKQTGDPTAHAEVLAITQAARKIGDWRLNDCTLYVTKEPCPMCAGATIMSRAAGIAEPVGNGRRGQIGGIHLNLNPVTWVNPDVVLAKLTRDTAEHDVLIWELDAEHRTREDLKDFTFEFENLAFRH